MRQKERFRIGPLSPLVNEVQINPADPDLELGKPVDRRFLATPVVGSLPVLAEITQIGGVCAERPGLTWNHVRPTGSRQPSAQVIQHSVCDIDIERTERRPIPARMRWPRITHFRIPFVIELTNLKGGRLYS